MFYILILRTPYYSQGLERPPAHNDFIILVKMMGKDRLIG